MMKLRKILGLLLTLSLLFSGIAFPEESMIELTEDQIAALTAAPEEEALPAETLPEESVTEATAEPFAEAGTEEGAASESEAGEPSPANENPANNPAVPPKSEAAAIEDKPMMISSLAESVSITLPEEMNLPIGMIFACSPEISPWNDDLVITWESNQPDVVSIDDAGMMAALQIGQATITVTVGEVSASMLVNVTPAPSSFALSARELNLVVGESVTLQIVDVQPAESYAAFVWETDNNAYATVDENGVVVAKSAGDVTITVTSHNGLSASCTVHVTATSTPDSSIASGTCGANLTWVLDENGTLTISGSGYMASYYGTPAPWREWKNSILSIKIENGVTDISSYAFFGCNNLTSVTIPEGVTDIGEGAFSGCSSLTRVTIPEGVTIIFDCTFQDCSSLTSVTIPVSVTSIESLAFHGCTSLEHVYYGGSKVEWNAITIAKSNEYLTKATLHAMYIDRGTCGSTLKWTLGSDYVLTISCTGAMNDFAYGFAPWNAYINQILSAVIENGATSIGNYAFDGCRRLASVTIPDSVTSIGESAFDGCTRLEDVTIPEGVTSIGDSAFYGCSRLTSVAIPKSMNSIDDYAFYGCVALTTVNYGGTKAEWEAFKKNIKPNNDPLLKATIVCTDGIYGDTSAPTPSSTPTPTPTPKPTPTPTPTPTLAPTPEASIASGTCGGNLIWALDKDYKLTISGTGAMTNHYTTDTVPWSSYANQIQSVVIESGVTSIGGYAFRECGSLTSVTIPKGVTIIGEQAFHGCRSLTSVTIPEGVTKIDHLAFYHCSGLKSITIPKSVTSIGESAFRGCSSLTSVTIPGSLTSISYCAFYDCDSLTSVTIPEGVSTIVGYAFQNCTNLKSITIPKGITSIGVQAFFGCGSLKDVYFGGTETEWNQISIGSFNDPLQKAKLHFAGEPDPTPTPIPEDIVLSGKDALAVGRYTTLKAKDLDGKSLSAKSLKWATSDKTIATVSSSGKVTAKKAGEVTITVTAKDGSFGTFDLAIYPKAKSVAIYYDGADAGKTLKIDLGTNEQIKLSAIVNPEGAMQEVTWKSSSSKIASVSADGIVTLKKAGKVTITATAKDGSKKKDTVTLQLGYNVAEIEITGTNEIAAGKSVTFKAKVYPENATSKSVTWTSSDKSIATVNSKIVNNLRS